MSSIVAGRRADVKEYLATLSPQILDEKIAQAPPVRSFAFALRRPKGAPMRLIAELKVASPSAGKLCTDLKPIRYVRACEEGGATALSVVIEPRFFLGSEELLRQVRGSTQLPVLAKDFMIDPVQIYLARAFGADAVLLLASLLSPETLREFVEIANTLGMDALVEVHDEEELNRAFLSGTSLIGINNRDLRTFQVNLATTEKLKKLIPPDYFVVSESGIKTEEDWIRVSRTGVDGVLIGEALVRSQNPRERIRSFLGLQGEG